MRGSRRTACLVVTAAALIASSAAAQSVDLVLSSTPNTFPAPTVADYDAAVVSNPTGVGFTITVNGGGGATRTTIVSIRATTGTLGGTKPIGDLEWRRSDLSAWNAMTTTNATVESRSVRNNSLNDPWSNTVYLRMKLGWTSDPPATYTTSLVFTLTLTTP